MEVLRLERENQQLKKSLDRFKTSNAKVSDLVREKNELHDKVMESKSVIHNLNEVNGPNQQKKTETYLCH